MRPQVVQLEYDDIEGQIYSLWLYRQFVRFLAQGRRLMPLDLFFITVAKISHSYDE
jgi:hypothetical protein